MKSFLQKYETLIFDMDGVVTSEQKYWDSAAMTVYEMLHSNKYFGSEEFDASKAQRESAKIRKDFFFDDALITVLKKKGVNSNWDLAYVTLAFCLIYGKENIFDAAKKLNDNILDEYNVIAEKLSQKLGKEKEYGQRNGVFWTQVHDCFQEWYLGTEQKQGFVFREEPLLELENLQKLLSGLHKEGKRLCIATGRPDNELVIHLEKWDIKRYFDPNAIITFDYVVKAEERIKGESFTKPHPYMFLKALYGADYEDEKIVKGDYDKEKIKSTLVVGDAGADILAAKAMGADFCAVLTGVSGKEAKEYFENQNSEYIFDSVLNLAD